MKVIKQATYPEFEQHFIDYRRCFLTPGSEPTREEVEQAMMGVGRAFEPMLRKMRRYAHEALRVAMLQACQTMLDSLWAPHWEHVLWDHCSTLWNGEHFTGEATWIERLSEQKLIDIYAMAVDADVWFHHPAQAGDFAGVIQIPLKEWRQLAAAHLTQTRRITRSN